MALNTYTYSSFFPATRIFIVYFFQQMRGLKFYYIIQLNQRNTARGTEDRITVQRLSWFHVLLIKSCFN